jgi:hypothetical protein
MFGKGQGIFFSGREMEDMGQRRTLTRGIEQSRGKLNKKNGSSPKLGSSEINQMKRLSFV